LIAAILTGQARSETVASEVGVAATETGLTRMYARVVTWEGGEADAIRTATDEIASRAASGPPEGVPSVGFTLLRDPEAGRVLAIGLFETEEDLNTAAAVLNEMTPPGEGMGERASVDVYEVAVDVRLDG